MLSANRLKPLLMGTVCANIIATAVCATNFNVPDGSLEAALNAYSAQSGVQVMIPNDEIGGVHSRGVKGNLPPSDALSRILSGTGFVAHHDSSGVVGIVPEIHSQLDVPPMQLAQATSKAAVETVTVTSSKLGNADVQSIPIAITALSEEQLQAQKIEGGPDLVKGVPNLTFTKTNFTGYNIQIRGIGTQAISTTTDPAVAVELNDIPFIRNHFFEQEFFDVSDVEVLRGPQGTLYGRNATAGVINVSSAKPTDQFEGQLKGELGTYSTKRARGFINIPIIGDKLDVRFAGSYLKRNGYTVDDLTDSHVDGRNLWSARASVRFRPTSWADINLVGEHFAEDDDRLRSGKQLCKRDNGPTSFDGVNLSTPITINQGTISLPDSVFSRGFLSQGCAPTSLYSPNAYQTPNTNSLPYFLILENGYPSLFFYGLPFIKPGQQAYALNQSSNLRTISSTIEPHYRATNNTVELNSDFNVTPTLTLTSQTGFSDDFLYSTEDYNRFATQPGLFFDSRTNRTALGVFFPGLAPGSGPAPDLTNVPDNTPFGEGTFCDPQLGCSDRLVGEDLSQAHSQQISQELRLASNLSGKFNFSAGANYTHYRTIEDYYVFINGLTMLSELLNNNRDVGYSGHSYADGTSLIAPNGFPSTNPFDGCGIIRRNPSLNFDSNITGANLPACVYVDPNPIANLDGQGHNYYRSQNPYTLNSYAGFAEAYYQVTPDLKLTAGLRWTDDNKTFTPVPTQLLLSSNFFTGGGLLDKGFYALPNIDQHWGEFTGRFVANWSPKIEFTDQSMFYASYSRGYKAGGANPPSVGYYQGGGTVLPFVAAQIPAMTTVDGTVIPAGTLPDDPPGYRGVFPYSLFGCPPPFGAPLCSPGPIGQLQTSGFLPTFKPEFIDAFEFGTKNTALDGALTVNGDVFFYNYYDYQISKIQDRTAINENFDAKVWGTEVEATWEPIPGLRFNFGGGYEGSRVGGHQASLDLMDRTDSNSNYIILKPFVTTPSNCVVQKQWVEDNLTSLAGLGAGFGYQDSLSGALSVVCSGRAGGGSGAAPGFTIPYDDPTVFPNGGQGIFKDVSGNELPNTPHFTVSLGAQYAMPVNATWSVLARTDFYYQSGSWARIYNDNPYDQLHGYTNVNFTIDLVKDSGLMVELYVKNALNTTAITGDFLNSDDSGLTTNVFTTDPRLVGISITQSF